jgi:hypothetical protein
MPHCPLESAPLGPPDLHNRGAGAHCDNCRTSRCTRRSPPAPRFNPGRSIPGRVMSSDFEEYLRVRVFPAILISTQALMNPAGAQTSVERSVSAAFSTDRPDHSRSRTPPLSNPQSARSRPSGQPRSRTPAKVSASCMPSSCLIPSPTRPLNYRPSEVR